MNFDRQDDVVLDKGEVLFETQEPLDLAYFLLEGSVDLQIRIGDQNLCLTIGENHFVGDASVAVSSKDTRNKVAYQGKAVVREKIRAVPIPINDIRSELENCSPLLKAWFASFISRVLTVVDSLSSR